MIEDSADFLRKVTHDPHGMVFVVAPWNYPYMTANTTIAPALIAGNVVIHKGAAQTILVGEHLNPLLPRPKGKNSRTGGVDSPPRPRARLRRRGQ